MDDGQVPDGTAFDLLHSEGAALYLSNHGHASLKSAPEELNDSLDGDSNSGLGDDSLDLANEKAFEVSHCVLKTAPAKTLAEWVN